MTTLSYNVCWFVFSFSHLYIYINLTATADEQRQSAEDRYDKLQQTLSKTRSDLEEARQMESQSKSTDLAVRGELETLRQQHEHLKVTI